MVSEKYKKTAQHKSGSFSLNPIVVVFIQLRRFFARTGNGEVWVRNVQLFHRTSMSLNGKKVFNPCRDLNSLPPGLLLAVIKLVNRKCLDIPLSNSTRLGVNADKWDSYSEPDCGCFL